MVGKVFFSLTEGFLVKAIRKTRKNLKMIYKCKTLKVKSKVIQSHLNLVSDALTFLILKIIFRIAKIIVVNKISKMPLCRRECLSPSVCLSQFTFSVLEHRRNVKFAPSVRY